MSIADRFVSDSALIERDEMTRWEIRLSGFGGQGIITAGYILGKASALNDGKEVTLTQSYGPESRGGACAANLIIADEEVHYPHVLTPSLLVAMSKEAFIKYAPFVPADGLILIDETLVSPDVAEHCARVVSVPATQIAEELGNKIVANIVILGALTAATDVVSMDGLRETISESVPPKTVDLNLAAFEQGYVRMQEALAQQAG